MHNTHEFALQRSISLKGGRKRNERIGEEIGCAKNGIGEKWGTEEKRWKEGTKEVM